MVAEHEADDGAPSLPHGIDVDPSTSSETEHGRLDASLDTMAPPPVKVKETRFGVEAETLVFDPSAALISYCCDETWQQWRGPVPTNFYEPEPCGGMVMFEGPDGQLYEEHPPGCQCAECNLQEQAVVSMMAAGDGAVDQKKSPPTSMNGVLLVSGRHGDDDEVEVTEDELIQEERRLTMELENQLMGESPQTSPGLSAHGTQDLFPRNPAAEAGTKTEGNAAAKRSTPSLSHAEHEGDLSLPPSHSSYSYPENSGDPPDRNFNHQRGGPKSDYPLALGPELSTGPTSLSPELSRTQTLSKSSISSRDMKSSVRPTSQVSPGSGDLDPDIILFSREHSLTHKPAPFFTGPIAQSQLQNHAQLVVEDVMSPEDHPPLSTLERTRSGRKNDHAPRQRSSSSGRVRKDVL